MSRSLTGSAGGGELDDRVTHSPDRARVMAATLTVTNTGDSGPGSLRNAIATAASGDTIEFDSSVFSSQQTITLTTGPLVVAQNVTIQGPGATLLSVSGNSASGVFDISFGFTVTLSGMTILAAGNVIQGGGIMNRGATTITNCVVRNNTANQGGGVQNDGTMTINHSTILENQASVQRGGGIVSYGSLTINNSLVANNNSANGGGGIHVADSGQLTITNSTVSGNGLSTPAALGGGILFETQQQSTVVNCTITNNRAIRGGGIHVSPGTVTLNNTIVAQNFGPDGTTPDDITTGVNASGSHNNLIGTAGLSGLIDGVNNNY